MTKNYFKLLLFIFLFQTTAYSNDSVVTEDTIQNLKTTNKSIVKIDNNKPVSIMKSEFALLFIKDNYPC
jgi:hypothetical protein